MRRRPCIVSITENGETRCGLTTAFFGLGGIPYRLINRDTDWGGNPFPLYQNMKFQSEISPEQYQEYLDHPEMADDFSAIIEIDADHNIIRVDEDMGEEREYHEFPIDLLLEKAQEIRSSFSKMGPNMISRKSIYRAMKYPAETSLSQKPCVTVEGLHALRDTANPSKPHSYRWYVIENINDPDRRVDHDLPLEEAVRLYAGLGCADKRLGVTKDGIASVDLAIRMDGREWVSEGWAKRFSFRGDQVIAEAAALLRQALEAQTPEQGMTIGGMDLG